MGYVLFVCKWNRFRSKAAEAVFDKINVDKDIHAQSAGLFPGVAVTSDIVEAGKKIGVSISKKQQGITHALLMWSDYIILVADDVPKSIFTDVVKNDGKKVIHWEIQDISGTNVDKRVAVMTKIKDEVNKFLANQK